MTRVQSEEGYSSIEVPSSQAILVVPSDQKTNKQKILTTSIVCTGVLYARPGVGKERMFSSYAYGRLLMTLICPGREREWPSGVQD